MKSDSRGCSTCGAGQEQYEMFTFGGKRRCQYEFRTPDGKLFATVKPTLEAARAYVLDKIQRSL